MLTSKLKSLGSTDFMHITVCIVASSNKTNKNGTWKFFCHTAKQTDQNMRKVDMLEEMGSRRTLKNSEPSEIFMFFAADWKSSEPAT